MTKPKIVKPKLGPKAISQPTRKLEPESQDMLEEPASSSTISSKPSKTKDPDFNPKLGTKSQTGPKRRSRRSTTMASTKAGASATSGIVRDTAKQNKKTENSEIKRGQATSNKRKGKSPVKRERKLSTRK